LELNLTFLCPPLSTCQPLFTAGAQRRHLLQDACKSRLPDFEVDGRDGEVVVLEEVASYPEEIPEALQGDGTAVDDFEEENWKAVLSKIVVSPNSPANRFVEGGFGFDWPLMVASEILASLLTETVALDTWDDAATRRLFASFSLATQSVDWLLEVGQR
ncbi:hypothetical protein ILUMI_22530, partial [Ignelater luminosus]